MYLKTDSLGHHEIMDDDLGATPLNGDEVGHQPHHNYGFSGKKNGVEYFRGKPLSPGWHLDKYGWPKRG